MGGSSQFRKTNSRALHDRSTKERPKNPEQSTIHGGKVDQSQMDPVRDYTRVLEKPGYFKDTSGREVQCKKCVRGSTYKKAHALFCPNNIRYGKSAADIVELKRDQNEGKKFKKSCGQ